MKWKLAAGTRFRSGSSASSIEAQSPFRISQPLYFSLVYEDNSGRQRLFYPDYIISIGGKVWILEVKGNFNASGGSENIDIDAPKKSAALLAYCAKHGVRGGFVCYDEGQDELLLNEGQFSENRNDPNWKVIDDVINGE